MKGKYQAALAAVFRAADAPLTRGAAVAKALEAVVAAGAASANRYSAGQNLGRALDALVKELVLEVLETPGQCLRYQLAGAAGASASASALQRAQC